MKFELEESNRGISDEELLDDMRRCAKSIGRDTITYRRIRGDWESPSMHDLPRRFGSWSKALELAGLQPTGWKIGITDEELFENIRSLWVSLGRQPRYSEVEETPQFPFLFQEHIETRFGSWTKALQAFVAWVNSDCPEQKPATEAGGANNRALTIPKATTKRRTRREISERQRFRILVRDGFRCGVCGASPLTQRGIELHVDHVLPWSKGGETTDDNLETKCKRCNLGKGNAFDV